MPTVKFMGHSCIEIANGKHNLIVDPFLTGNGLAPVKQEDIKVDYVILSHGHGDHFGDTVEIAKRNNATVIANNELAHFCGTLGLKFHPMHIGGAFDFDFGRVKMTIAHHGGGYGENAGVYTGPPVGLLITMDGKTLFHAGDTGLFYDMKLIGEMHKIDLAFLPIGDNFTMGIEDAAKAAEFLKPEKIVPIHYNTFDIIKQDPQKFAAKVKDSEVIILNPGESLDY